MSRINDTVDLNPRDDQDDITQECYEHWLASSESTCELNLAIVNNRLILGPCDKPIASVNQITGTQIDGGAYRRGLYRVNSETLVMKSNYQTSRSSESFKDLMYTTFLCRIITLSSTGDWIMSPLGIYYQLSRFFKKRCLPTVTDASTQTDLSSESRDKIVNDRLPELAVGFELCKLVPFDGVCGI